MKDNTATVCTKTDTTASTDFLAEPSIEDLVGKEIVMTDNQGWSKTGTIMPTNKDNYQFIYRVNAWEIAGVNVNEWKPQQITSNIYSTNSHAGQIINYHDKNDPKFNFSNALGYDVRDEFLKKATINKRDVEGQPVSF